MGNLGQELINENYLFGIDFAEDENETIKVPWEVKNDEDAEWIIEKYNEKID